MTPTLLGSMQTYSVFPTTEEGTSIISKLPKEFQSGLAIANWSDAVHFMMFFLIACLFFTVIYHVIRALFLAIEYGPYMKRNKEE